MLTRDREPLPGWWPPVFRSREDAYHGEAYMAEDGRTLVRVDGEAERSRQLRESLGLPGREATGR